MAAVEIDPIHAATHKFNFPNCTVFPTSITNLSSHKIRKGSSITSRHVDIVFGGPPCQGFSLIGQRMLDDPRNTLVRDFVRVVAELSASYFLFENVKGLTLGEQRRFLEELVIEFDRSGYAVLLPWCVLNAAHYGVPQDRERLFLLGAKHGFPLPKYPVALTVPRSRNRIMSLLPEGPSCRDALSDLPEAEGFEELNHNDSVYAEHWGEPSEYGEKLRCLAADSWHYGYKRHWDRNLLTSSARTNHTMISRRRFASTNPGEVEPISRFFKLSSDSISNTLRAGTDSARGAFTSPRPIHYERNRCITVREMARLHSFPDWFRFQKTKWHGARQVGNAVPPLLAKALATEFIEILGIKPELPTQALELDDVSLLGMDMKSAARYWQVEVTIARRNRKSGARKRKQEDIEAELLASRTMIDNG